MPLIFSSRDDDAARPKGEVVPPLFAQLLSDEPVERVKSSAREPEVDAALAEAQNDLADDRFVSALGRFREALLLSRGDHELELRVCMASISEAAKATPDYWWFAEALLKEVAESAPADLLEKVRRAKGDEKIRVILEEPIDGYLPPLRTRLAGLSRSFPGNAALDARLQAVDTLMDERLIAEREDNLKRVTRFSQRLDLCDSPETLRRFHVLVSPFIDPQWNDQAFAAVVKEVGGLQGAHENAITLLADDRTREAVNVCEQVLAQRPNNILFKQLAQKARAREWALEFAEARPVEPDPPLRPEPLVTPPVFIPEQAPTHALWGLRIAITEEAWNYLKTGLAVAIALMLMMLVLASRTKH